MGIFICNRKITLIFQHTETWKCTVWGMVYMIITFQPLLIYGESLILWCYLNRKSYLQKYSSDHKNFSLCFILVLPSPLPLPHLLSPACHIFRNIWFWWLVSSLMFKQKNDSPPTNYCFSGLNLKHSHLPLFDRHCPFQKVLFAIMPYQCNSRNLRNFFTVKSSSSWLCFTRVASISIKPRVMDAQNFKNKIITQ